MASDLGSLIKGRQFFPFGYFQVQLVLPSYLVKIYRMVENDCVCD